MKLTKLSTLWVPFGGQSLAEIHIDQRASTVRRGQISQDHVRRAVSPADTTARRLRSTESSIRR